MLWIPQPRQTRSGASFLPFTPIALCSPDFDFAAPLAESVERECVHGDDPDEDHEDEDDDADSPAPDPLNEVDALYPPPPLPPPADPWNEVDDTYPPPRAHSQPRRTALDDMREGKKPLTRSHRNRKEKRAQKKLEEGHVPRRSTFGKHVRAALVQPLKAAIDASTLPAAHGGYAAKTAGASEVRGSKRRRTLDELVQLGFQVVKWNGFDPRPLVDAHGRIFAVLVGQPRDAAWAAAVNQAYHDITAEGAAATFSRDMRNHRRGLFAALNVGLSYGKGQTAPSRLLNPKYDGLLNRLLSNPAIERMANFASAAFQLWAPRLYNYYRDHNEALYKHLPHLRRNFPRSVFSCAAFNFGPNVWTFRHRDVLNVPFGWCAIQAAGPFDATQGGHLVLWDVKLVVEFPHGALILVPSATIAHSNVPVQAGDARISFTQFTAGGLIRYVDNGFRTDRRLEEDDPCEFKRLAELKHSRWLMGLGLLSTLDELLGDSPAE
ncbi:hypothetical protein FB451DRAFT_1134182 [Mycena latifolia]|nr:hypothetical protein FB451DRAFT_1134182 [Mycena latifolia]